MPGIHIHLAIGNRYIEKHKVENEKEFLEGIIAPDFAESKDKSHYTVHMELKDNFAEYVKEKINLENFLKENKVQTDYEKGVYLHLLTDDTFFRTFFEQEYLESTNYDDFMRDLYYSYGVINQHLIKKYNISLSEETVEKIKRNIEESIKQKKVKEDNANANNILPIEKIDKFIEKLSDVNLDNI